MGRQNKKKATNKRGSAPKASKGSHEHKKQRKNLKKTSSKKEKAKKKKSLPNENVPHNDNYTIAKETPKMSEEKDEKIMNNMSLKLKNASLIIKNGVPPNEPPKVSTSVLPEKESKMNIDILLTLIQILSFIIFMVEMALLPLVIHYLQPYLYFDRFIGTIYYLYLILPILTIFISLFFIPILAYSIICFKLDKLAGFHRSVIKQNARIQYFLLLSFLFVGTVFVTFNLYHEPDSFSRAIEASIVQSRRGRYDIHQLQLQMNCCGTRVKGFKAPELTTNSAENPLNAWYKHYNMTDYYEYGSSMHFLRKSDFSTYPFAFNGVPASCCKFLQLSTECSHIFSLEISENYFKKIAKLTSLQVLLGRYDQTTGSLNHMDCSYALTDGLKNAMFIIGCISLAFAFLHTACAILTSILTSELNRQYDDESKKEPPKILKNAKEASKVLNIKDLSKEILLPTLIEDDKKKTEYSDIREPTKSVVQQEVIGMSIKSYMKEMQNRK